VIILGGTNDVEINENYDLKLRPAIKTILETTKKTILNAIPKRFDYERLNFETSRANKQIHGLVNNEPFEKTLKT